MNIPDTWIVTTVGKLCDQGGGSVQTGPFGSQLHAEDYKSDGVPVVMPQNLGRNKIETTDIARIDDQDVKRLAQHRLETGDIVFPRRGDVSRYAYITKEYEGWLCGTGCLRIRLGKSQVDPKYLAYYLGRSETQDWIIGNAVGTTMLNLNTSIVRALPVVVPPLDEQRAIAHILGTLDDKIELNRRMNATLEAIARAIFKSWFVDFDPVRAKMRGEQPAGMDAATAALFPDAFEDSELGPIPAGWGVGTLGEHMINLDSKRVPMSRAERANRQGPYPYYGAASVIDYVDDFLFDGIYLLVGEDGSVLRENGLGVTQYVWGQIWVNNHAHVLQGKGSVSTEQLLFYFDFQPVAPYVTGAVQPKLSQGRMNQMPFVYAGNDVCRAFHRVVSPYLALLRANTEQNRTLTALRDALLPKLISGEIRVEEAIDAVTARD